jgi:hypothetical protein
LKARCGLPCLEGEPLSSLVSQAVLKHLSSLIYRADAKLQVCILPLASIHWEDEIPSVEQLFELSDGDQRQVLCLFAIRFKIWDGKPLSEDEQAFWAEALAHAPGCPLFQRLTLSPENQRAREDAERDCAEELEGIFAHADRITFKEDAYGFQTFSGTFDFTGDQTATSEKKPWWRRFGKRAEKS